MIDIMTVHFKESLPEIKCLDKGVVRLIDIMPRVVDAQMPTIDSAIVQAARVSYGAGTKTLNEDRGLIRYLLRHRHTTPFEMVEFKFLIKCPMFIGEQILRHRTASINKISGRYSIMKDEFYIPNQEEIRAQSSKNKQCSEGQLEEDYAASFVETLENCASVSFDEYMRAVDIGVGREQARMVLPANLYTEFYWKIDLHNLLHFLALRSDAHAQKEIQDYANAIINLIKPLAPMTIEAWEDYHPMRGAMILTRLEIEHLKKLLTGMQLPKDLPKLGNKREEAELVDKFAKLGISLGEVQT